MKILFYSVNSMWLPLLETELELMLNHKEQGDEIFVLTCSGALPTCFSNFDHVKTGCMKCQSRFNIGMNIVGIPKRNIFYIQKKTIPADVPDTFAGIDELMQWKVEGIDFGRMIASSLISNLRDHNPDVRQHHKKIRLKMLSVFHAFYSMDDTIKKVNPDLVYIYNGRFCEVAAAVAACKKNGTKFYTHERGGTPDSYALFKNSIPHDFKANKNTILSCWQQEPNESKKSHLAEEWFLQQRGGAGQAAFSYTVLQKKGLLPQGMDSHKMNIAIFNSSIDEYSTFPEWQNPLYQDELEALKSILEHFKHNENMHFYLRVHPHLKGFDNSQMKTLKNIAAHGYKNLSVIWPEEVVDSYALMDACNKVVVFGSTMGVEACFWGKPVILIGKGWYEHLDCCYLPQTRDQAMHMIADNLEPKAQRNALPYAFWMQSKGIPSKMFKPNGLWKGTFQGKELKPVFGLKDKILFRIYDRLDRWKSKNI